MKINIDLSLLGDDWGKDDSHSNEEKLKEAKELLLEVKAADSALRQLQDILQAMKEVSELAANKSVTWREQLKYQKQMNQLTSELNRIAGSIPKRL